RRAGEHIAAGEPLFVLEGEKATENIEAITTGILHIPPDAPRPGTTVKVGQVLAFVLTEGEAAPASVAASDRSVLSPPLAGESSSSPHSPDLGGEGSGVRGRFIVSRTDESPNSSPPSSGDRGERRTAADPRASPRARRVARELAIDWTTLHGSGRNGRIRERD